MDEFRPNYEDEDHAYPLKDVWDKMEPKQRALFVTAVCLCFIAAVTMLISYTPSMAQTQKAVAREDVAALQAEVRAWAIKHQLHLTIITDCKLAAVNRGRLEQAYKDHCLVSTNPIEMPWIVVCEGKEENRVCYRRY